MPISAAAAYFMITAAQPRIQSAAAAVLVAHMAVEAKHHNADGIE